MRPFYERRPYPPPVDNLDRYRRLWQDGQRRRAEHHLLWPAHPLREEHAILVAGCGTAQAAKVALRWPRARVTGIDFSSTSVRCTESLKRRHGLDNLTVRQLPIAEVARLGSAFDQIVCTGVLHHLPDPDAGLRALRAVLAPGGAMHLMVYAPYGRTGITMLQELCKRMGIGSGAGDEELRDLLSTLEALPPGHPLAALLRTTPDLRDEAALADALLHPQERAYTVPELFAFLVRSDVVFGRWLKEAPYSPHCGLMATARHAGRIARLPPVDQAAAVELLRGTMLRHSVIAHADAGTAAAQRLDFTGHRWQRYVPIRAPDAIAIEERLPAGAAAVLINRTHASPDIHLVIDGREKAVVDAVDGVRSAGEIARAVGWVGGAATFFERLHQHDQVVFDTSG
ncbi:MAG: class I SAM-dependent methyltransferase [Pseudomonadota bacterium]